MAQDNIVIPKGYLQENFGTTQQTFAAPPSSAPETHEFWDWGDVGMGVLAAPVELASDLYGLADAITFDALPDWEAEDLVGKRTSTAGNLVQEVLPWLFTFTKVAKFVGAGARIGKTRYLKGLSKTSEKLLARQGRIKSVAATRIGRDALASSLTTMSLHEKQHGTLTDLLQTVPYLQDVVPDFLESDPDDGEAVSRLKAGLEDAALGGIIDTALVVFKGVRATQAAKRANPEMTPEEIDKLADELIDQNELAAAMESDGIVSPSAVDTAPKTLDDAAGSGGPKNIWDMTRDEFEEAARRGGVREATGKTLPGEDEATTALRMGEINEYSQDDIAFFYANKRGAFPENNPPGTQKMLQEKIDSGEYDPFETALEELRADAKLEGKFDAAGAVDEVPAFAADEVPASAAEGPMMYHWSPSDVAPDAYTGWGKHFGTEKAAQHRRSAVGEGDPARIGADNLEVIPNTLTEKNAIRLEDQGAWNPSQVIGSLIDTGRLSDEAVTRLREIDARYRKAWDEADSKGTLDESVLNPQYSKEARDVLKEDGFDGIIYKNATEDPGSDAFILFDPPPKAKAVDEVPLPRTPEEEAASAAARVSDQADDFVPDNAQELLDIAERRDPSDWGEVLNPRERLDDGNYKYSTAELFRRLTLRRGLNVQNSLLSTTNPEDMINLIRALDLKHLDMVRGKTQTTEEHLRGAIDRMTDLYGVDDNGLIQMLSPELGGRKGASLSDADLLRELGEVSLAHEMTMAPLFDQFKRVMKKAEKGGNPDDLIDAMKSLEAFATATSGVRDFRSELGRQFRFLQTPLGGLQPSEIKKILAEQGLDQKAIQRQIDRITAALKNSKGLNEFEQMAGVAKMLRGRKFRWGDVVTEYWVNSILSGPTTHVANILGNSITLVLRPLELAGASAITLNSRGMRAAFEQVKSITSDTIDALSLGLSVERNEFLRPIGSTKWQGVGRNRSIGRHTLSQDFVDKNPGMASVVEGVGKLVNVPGTALETMDNFFKQINFRSRVKMRLYDKAISDLGLDSTQAAEYVVREMDRVMENGQLIASETFFNRGLEIGMKQFKGDKTKALPFAKKYARKQFKENREFVEEAMVFAEEGTFTRRHSEERGKLSYIASGLQQFTAKFWPARFFIPFVGTPTNLLLFAADRMNPMEMARLVAEPFNFKKSTPALNEVKSRLVNELRSGDVIKQREAMGRVIMGNAMIVTAWNLTMNGKLTGRGPQDLQERKLWEQAGHQPYSFVVDGKHYSYLRLDPFATIFGTVADVVSTVSQSSPEDTSAAEATIQGLWSALQNNFTQKSYMTGLKALTQLASDDPDVATRALRPIFGGFVPSAVTRTLGVPAAPVTGDDTMREVNGLLEYALARVPYYNKTLPPQRNVLGDVIKRKGTISRRPGMSMMESMFLPIQYTEVKEDSILSEFASLPGTAFYPPQKTQGGLDYREFENSKGQDAYDRFLELHGIVTVDGMTMKQALRDLFKSKRYQQASPDSLPGVPSPRGEMIKQYINVFRRAARNKLLREYPEITQAKLQLQMTSRKQAVAEALNISN